MTQLGESVIVGVLEGLEARGGGFTRFNIKEPGMQYPTRVDTKQPETIDAAKALIGEYVKAEINAIESTNINPNNNRPYVNKYLNRIVQARPEDGAQTAQNGSGAAPARSGGSGAGQIDAAVKELHILREKAMDLVIAQQAAGSLPLDASPVEMVQAAEVHFAYFVWGPARFGISNAEVAQQAEEQEQHDQFAAGQTDDRPPLTDDDIPF